MTYDERALKEITEKYQDKGRVHDKLILQLRSLFSKLTNTKAKEYLIQGAGRRLNVLTRCIENIFRIFPIGQTEQLTSNELTDLSINLHAFFVNVSGLFDNLAWVFAFEYDLTGEPKNGKLGQFDIGLFNKKTQSHLSDRLRNYLKAQDLQNWHSEYSKNYRDALAHRIPLYVPPSVLNPAEQKKYFELETQIQTLDLTKYENLEIYGAILEQQMILGQASPFFAQSGGEKSRPVFLHTQVLADYATIEEVVTMFCEHFEPKTQ
jgi:hypothetical protein